MSTTTPAAPSSATTSREALIHNLSLGALVVCPIIILIPPRKLDIYTVFLTAGFFAGGNELAREYTGKSIASRFGSRVTSIAANRTELEATQVESKAKEEEKGLLRKVWYGAEGPDWKAKRDKREKEALEQGRGYGGLIIDQIYEVWGWGKGKAEEVKEIDEKVVRKEQEQEGKK
ncbi:hypothetical protein BUE80_DR011347 [Diplocarpon rosae]|nr:hypothetical protein BUE80_DR011347 [Diplocarpon rosae]